MDEQALNEKLESQAILDDLRENSSSDESEKDYVFEMVDKDFFKSFEDDFDEEEFEPNDLQIIDLPIIRKLGEFRVEALEKEKEEINKPLSEKKQQNESSNSNSSNTQNMDVSLNRDSSSENNSIKEPKTASNQDNEIIQNSSSATEKSDPVQNLNQEKMKKGEEEATSDINEKKEKTSINNSKKIVQRSDEDILYEDSEESSEKLKSGESEDNCSNEESEEWDTSIDNTLGEDDLFVRAINETELRTISEKSPLINEKYSRLVTKICTDLHITEVDLKNANININALRTIAHQTAPQRFLRFLASASIARTLLLMPFLSRNRIKLNKTEIKENYDEKMSNSTSHIEDEYSENENAKEAKQKSYAANETSQNFIEDDDDNLNAQIIAVQKKQKYQIPRSFQKNIDKSQSLSPLLTNDKNLESQNEKVSELKNNESIEGLPESIESENLSLQDQDITTQKEKKCRTPIFTSSAILVESDSTLKQVLGVSAFHETVEVMIEGVWQTFLSSLLINAIINFYRYPEEREGATLLSVFGFTSILNMICIEKIEFFRNNFCFSTEKEYEQVLASSLDKPFIWPLLISLPIVFGSINAFRAALHSQSLTANQLQVIETRLKTYQPSLWRDTGGWMVTALIPDMIPVATFLAFLPQPGIKHNLEKIKDSIVWDGRVSVSDRHRLFKMLREFSRRNHKLTQLYTISTLAQIINNIEFDHLPLLKDSGVDDKTLKALIYIKTEAFRELRFLSRYYNLPHEPEKSRFKPLLRYVYANYLMWSIGFPQHHGFNPLFFAYKAFKLYFTLMFYKAIIQGIIEIINRKIEQAECEAEGNKWLWMEPWKNYTCSLCGDLPVFINQIYSPLDCLNNYFEQPRTVKEILNVCERFKEEFSNGNFNILKLSKQKSIIQDGNLPALLSVLEEFLKSSPFLTIEFGPYFLNLTDMQAISNLINNSNKFLLDFTDSRIEKGGIFLLAETLAVSFSNVLDFSRNKIDITDIIALAKNINPIFVSLTLDSCNLGDKELKAFAENVQVLSPGLSYSFRNNNISSEGCIALVNKTFYPRGGDTTVLNIDLGNNFINSACVEEIALRLPVFTYFTNIDLSLNLDGSNIIGDTGINALANALRNSSVHIPPNYKSFSYALYVSTYNVSYKSITNLIDAISQGYCSKFSYMNNYFEGYFNYSDFIPRLVKILSGYGRFSFGWGSQTGHGFGDKEIEIISNLISNNTVISLLDFSYNQISPRGMKFLSIILKNSSISDLRLNNNMIGEGVIELAKILNQTNIKYLYLANNNISASDINEFSKYLGNYSLEYLDLSGNLFGGETVIWEGLINSESLVINDIGLNDRGLEDLGNTLIHTDTKHGLWIDELNTAEKESLVQMTPVSSIATINIDGNNLTDIGMQFICGIVPYTYISPAKFFLESTPDISKNIMDNCGITSAGSSIRPLWNYMIFYRAYQSARQSIEYSLFNYHTFKSDKPNNNFHTPNEVTVSEIQNFPSSLDASVVSNDFIIVNLDKNIPLNSYVDDQYLSIPENIIAFKGSSQSNHLLIGGNETLFDMTQSHIINLILAGKNNYLKLGFWSKDHIIVLENQGTTQIQGFESKDTLHIIEFHRVYPLNAKVVCRDEVLDNHLPVAVIRLKETTVQLINTNCESIENNVRLNDEEALCKAQAEVMQTSPTLYANLLKLCETFLSSVEKASFITAVPRFVTELVYRLGSHTREQAEAFGQELQRDLMIAFASSPYSLTAGYLATWMASRLTNSPRIVSIAAISATLTVTAIETLLTQNISFGWMILNTGVALMGSIAGSVVVDKLPGLCAWSCRKAGEAKNYLGNKMHFWNTGREHKKFSIDDLPTVEEIATEPLRNGNSVSTSSMQF